MKKPIILKGVRQNNLKNINVEIPPKQLTVITGLSGSGKSSLAFDTLYAEGQRRYVESLSTYTRQFLDKMPKPDLDLIQNIPPAIALEQKNHVVGSRSTVGTQTEIVDYLRLLYAKIGRTYCMDCGERVVQIDTMNILDWAIEWLPEKKALILAPLTDIGAEPKTKEKKSKKPVKKTKTPQSSATLHSLIPQLMGQGYQRLYWRKSASDFEILELSDLMSGSEQPIPESALKAQQLYLVIDRLKLSGKPDAETRGRLLDSIDQASALSQGRVAFFDSAAEEFKEFNQRFACLKCGKEHRKPEPQLFAFGSPVGACPRCSGFGFNLEIDEKLVVPDPTKTLRNGAIDPLSKPSLADWQKDMFRFAERHGISIGKKYLELTVAQKKLLWEGDPKDDTFMGILPCFEDLKKWKYKLHIRVFIRRYQTQSLCPDCQGTRLRSDSLAVKIGKLNIAEALNLSISDALNWFRSLELTQNERKIASDIFDQVERRLNFLDEVGVGYLTLSRPTKTLSGGEFQRINIATQLGNGLCGTLYVLDEPSIGLHASDTNRLIRVLHRLRDQGNTVVVVEHDLEVMRQANHLIELGPNAGKNGGEIVAQGSLEKLAQTPGSLTGKYLSGAFKVDRDRSPRLPPKRFLKMTGCSENNLKNITVEIPLDRLVVITGVSGSGKSTLVHKTLFTALSKAFYKTPETPGQYNQLYGTQQISGVVLLDQSPIGKSSRSNPATYLKAWDEVRRIYANQVLSLRRGYTAQHFSFNVDGGRCPVCKGEGEITLDMHFMAEVKLPCEECSGKRFKKNILDVTYRGKNIHQLLHTTINEAFELFRDNAVLVRKLGFLREVGLGYLQVGQSSTTLSGGESQRLKIAATLDDREAENLLYIFDEPTTGLHLEDVKRLMRVINDLIDSRHSVIMIEHHLDVIAQADYILDLGPGGGVNGGQLIACGTPAELFEDEKSVTGAMLRSQGYVFPSSHRG